MHPTDIGGGCFQSIAVDANGKIFTFGDNPSGQLGLNNFSRCYSPKLMPLDVNGQINKASWIDFDINKDALFKMGKYILLIASLFANIILYKKLKSKEI